MCIYMVTALFYQDFADVQISTTAQTQKQFLPMGCKNIGLLVQVQHLRIMCSNVKFCVVLICVVFVVSSFVVAYYFYYFSGTDLSGSPSFVVYLLCNDNKGLISNF